MFGCISQLAKLFYAFLISVVCSDHSHRAILSSSTHPVSSVHNYSLQVHNPSILQMTGIVHRQVGRTTSNREVGRDFST